MKALLIVLVPFLAAGCDVPQASCKFERGDIVRFVVNDQRAQIIAAHTGHRACFYTVRFSAAQYTTNTRVFGPDHPISESAMATLEFVREFELRGEKEK